MPTPDLDPRQILAATVKTLTDVQNRLGPLARQRCVCGAVSDAQLVRALECLDSLETLSKGLRAVLEAMPADEPVDVDLVQPVRLPMPGTN